MYEGYQLTNSTQMPAYVGSTLPEMIRVSDVLNQRYQQSVEGLDASSELIRNAKALPQDQALLAQRAGEFNNFIKQTSARKDLENVTPEVYRTAKRFASEYQNFASNVKLAQDYREELDKSVNEGKISRDRADKAMRLSHDLYSGLKYDPTTGRYEGQFQGLEPAHEVDKVAWVKKAVGDVAASSNSTVVEREDGLYFKTHEGSMERVTWDKIKPALDAAYKLDGMLQADVNQDAKFQAHDFSKISLGQLDGNKDTKPIADAARRIMQSDPKISEKEALAMVGAEYKTQSIKNNLDQLAKKYIYSKSRTSDTIGGETFGAHMALAKAALPPDTPPIILSDADTRLSDKERDISTLRENVKTANDNITMIDAKLKNAANLHPDEVADLRRQKAQLESSRYSQEAIIKGAGDEVARRMNYKSEADFYAKNKSSFEAPRVGMMYSLSTHKNDDYVGKKVASTEPGPYGSIKVKFVDGTTGLVSKQEHNDAVSKFEKAKQQEVKDNADKYAIKPSVVTLPENLSKSIKTALVGSPTAAEWYEPGTTEPLKSKDIPKDFDLSSVQLVKHGGATYLKAAEKSTEKGTVGQLTGKTFTIKVGPGNNLGEVVGKSLLYHNGKLNSNRDALASASVLLGGNWSGTLMNLQNNEKLPVTTSKGDVVGYVERKGYGTNAAASRYLIYDSKGNDISTALSEDFRSDPTAVAGWIEKALASEENKK